MAVKFATLFNGTTGWFKGGTQLVDGSWARLRKNVFPTAAFPRGGGGGGGSIGVGGGVGVRMGGFVWRRGALLKQILRFKQFLSYTFLLL